MNKTFTMKIISNIDSNNNHLSRLYDLFSQNNEVIIASPFLMTDFTNFFSNIKGCTVKKIHLITTIPEYTLDQFSKINSLISLINVSPVKNGEIECSISINNRLHGKVYLFINNNEYTSAIISSANFTNKGLVINHEWGIEIEDCDIINSIGNEVLGQIKRNLSHNELNQLKKIADNFISSNPSKNESKINLSLIRNLEGVEQIFLNPNTTYWLKPIGYTDAPVEKGRAFSALKQDMHFSKLRPNGVNVGDIFIAYGVGSKKILSVYKCISHPQHVTQEEIDEEEWLERWPWYVESENLTPIYGNEWWQYELYLSDLLNSFLTQYPTEAVTMTGNQTLGAINFGKDKIRLSKMFAKYILEQILDINNS